MLSRETASHFIFDIIRQGHADAEVDVLQLLLDFLNGFLAAVPMFEQFGFGLFNEFEDMLDLQGFENVDGTNGELEGIDSLAQLLKDLNQKLQIKNHKYEIR